MCCRATLCSELRIANFPSNCHMDQEHKLSGQKNPLKELLKQNIQIRWHSCGLLGAIVAELIALFYLSCQADSEQKWAAGWQTATSVTSRRLHIIKDMEIWKLLYRSAQLYSQESPFQETQMKASGNVFIQMRDIFH